MDDSWVDAYLARIGAERPARPDAGALRELHIRHLLTVPFEKELGDDADVLAAYRTWFGIELDRVPELRPPVSSCHGAL